VGKKKTDSENLPRRPGSGKFRDCLLDGVVERLNQIADNEVACPVEAVMAVNTNGEFTRIVLSFHYTIGA
jgi:hypothetical protein